MSEELRKLHEEIKDLQRQQQSIEERLKMVSRRLADYEAGRLPGETASAPEAPGVIEGPAAPPAAAAASLPPAAAAPAAPASGDLESRIGGIWLNRIGVIVFILGAAFFLMYAFEQGWINELTRVLIGVVTSFTLLALGERSRRRGYHGYAQGLAGGGIGLLYFSIFAAFYYYEIISPPAGLALMILVTLGAVALSVYRDAPAIAALGLLTGFLNPLLFVVREPQFLYLFLYLILLNVGINAVTYFKRWTFMGVAAFIITNMYLMGVLIYRFTNPELAPGAVAYQVYLSIFLLLFLALPLLLYTARRRHQAPLGVFLLLAGAASYYILSLFNLRLHYEGETGLFTLALAGFYLLAGLGLQRLPFRDTRAFFTAFGVTGVLLFFFVPIQFTQPWITVGWLLLALAFCFLGLFLAKPVIRVGFWVVLAITLLHLVASEWFSYAAPLDYVFLWNRPAALTLLFMTALVVCAWLYHRYAGVLQKYPSGAIRLLGAATGMLLLIYGSMEIVRYGDALAALTENWSYYHNMRMIFLSLFWAVYAVALALAGFIGKLPLLRFSAIALFGLTVLKVFFFDLSALELVYRIISLVGLGLILLAVSYLYQLYRSRINSL